MLTLRYNEPVFILMLRGRKGCLWLQSIKNLLYMKSCMCDSLYFSVQHGIVMSKITGYYFGLINSKTCCSTLAPVTKHRMKEVTVVLAQQILMSARPSYTLCIPYMEILVNGGARFTKTPGSRCGHQKASI